MKLADYFASERGAQTRLFELTGIHRPLLSNYARGVRPVPIERCLVIEEATGGKVTRRDLRDDWLTIWPELDRRAAPRKAAKKRR
jgi:DNA-binding transcriptional regulator YdaS (Cro superfamily)